MSRVVRRKIRSTRAGMNVVADVNAVVVSDDAEAAGTERRGAASHQTIRIVQHSRAHSSSAGKTGDAGPTRTGGSTSTSGSTPGPIARAPGAAGAEGAP